MYVTSETLGSFLPAIRKALADKISTLLRAERNGDKNFPDLAVQCYTATYIYGILSEYIVPGTIVQESSYSYCLVNMSNYNSFAATANDVNILAEFQLGTTVFTLYDGTLNIAGLNINDFIDVLVDAINTNTGTTGFSAENQNPIIKIFDVANRTDSLNGGTINISINPFVGLVGQIDSQLSIGTQHAYTINEPGSPLDGYTVGINGAEQKIYFLDTENAPEEIVDSNIFNRWMPIWNASNNCIYQVSPPNLRIWERTAPNVFILRGTIMNANFTFGCHYAIYNRLNNCNYYCSDVLNKIIKVYNDSLSTPTIVEITDGTTNFDEIELNPYNGELLTYCNDTSTDDGTNTNRVKIIDPLNDIVSSTVILNSPGMKIASLKFIDKGDLLSSQWMILWRGATASGGNIVEIYSSDFSSVIGTFTIPNASYRLHYSNVLSKILIVYGSVKENIKILNLDTPSTFTTISTYTYSGTCVNQRLTDVRKLNAVSLNTKMQLASSQFFTFLGMSFGSTAEFVATVQNGSTDVEWQEAQNCLTDEQMNYLLEELKLFLGVIDCNIDTLTTPSDQLEGLNGMTLLTTSLGVFVNTANAEFIQIN